jgi:hypothetical protein
MKFEALMLRSLCAIGMLVCALVLGAMLLATPTSASNRMTANTVHATLAACSPAATAEASPPVRS